MQYNGVLGHCGHSRVHICRYEFGSCVRLSDLLVRSDVHAHVMLPSDQLPLPARNAQFATSVERFLGLEHIRSHCFAAPILSL
jgi:hypothetical protein